MKIEQPSKELVKQARENAGLSQSAAAALVWITRDAWAKYESGSRPMNLAGFELFLIKTDQLALLAHTTQTKLAFSHQSLAFIT
jgi:DNA-binding transcriptional regulator YiaG